VRIPELTADQYKALIEEGKANRPKNPEPDLVPETIFPPYDKLPAQFQTLHLWALRRVLPLVKTWELNLQYDLSRLHQARTGNPHPLGRMPLVVLTASDFNVAQVPGMTADSVRQDHLRLQCDLASLSTVSRLSPARREELLRALHSVAGSQTNKARPPSDRQCPLASEPRRPAFSRAIKR
jgi:hypothetical protein